MKKRIIFLFLLVTHILVVGYANNSSYYDNLYQSAHQEIDNQNYARAMEYLMKIKVHAKENKLFDMEIDVLNKMGVVYTEILDYEKAMECYLEAYRKISEKSDGKKEINILNNIAKLYYLTNDIDKAAEYFDRAYKIAVTLNDSAKMIGSLNNMGIISNKKGNLEQTEKYLRIATEMVKDYPKNSFLTMAIQYVKAEYLYLKKEYYLAEQLSLEALNLGFGKGRLNQELEVEYVLLLSKIYYQKKNYSKATSFAKDALKRNSNLSMTVEIYEHLSNLYRVTNSLSLAMQYQDSVIKMKDVLLKLNNMSQLLKGQIQFDLNDLEKKMEANKEKRKRDQLVFSLIIVFIVIFTVMFIWIFRIRLIKNKQLKIIAELELKKEKNEKLLLEQQLKEQEAWGLLEQERMNNEIKEKMLLKQQLKEQETLAWLKQEQMNNEIELKNKQLISKTLFQLSKNKLIEEIIQSLFHIPNQSDIPELQPIIRTLQSQLKESAGADWNSFLTYFEQTNPSFLSALKAKHLDLTASDIRLASYIYLNLDTKEMAKLLHVTPEYCRKRKQQLAKKLELSSTKLYNYLANIV